MASRSDPTMARPWRAKDGASWPIMGLRAIRESDALHPDPNLPTVIRSGFFLSGSGVMLQEMRERFRAIPLTRPIQQSCCDWRWKTPI